MPQIKKIFAFNWKMNPASLAQALNLFKFTKKNFRSKKLTLIIAAPFIFLEELAKVKKPKNMFLAAEDVFWQNPPGPGAYTGEISLKMLKNLGVKYVIIGHSERREYLKETDKLIAKKVKASLKADLKVILCLGEKQRKGSKFTQKERKFIESQLKKDLAGVRNWKLGVRNLIIAYEPRWAIGTGKFDNPQDANLIAGIIKKYLKNKFDLNTPLLYGGSVNSKNIKQYLNQPNISGALIGGASLKRLEIKRILN